MNYGYHGIIQAGWKSGIHDCRCLTYQHPWLVVDRESESVVGCYSREDARRVWREIKKYGRVL